MPSKTGARRARSSARPLWPTCRASRPLSTSFANERKMLSRSLSEIYENVRDFFVVEDGGAVVGSAALHVFWGDLAEVRALAVADGIPEHWARAAGSSARARGEARKMGIRRVFALTFQARISSQARLRRHQQGRAAAQGMVRLHQVPDVPELRRDRPLFLSLEAQPGEPARSPLRSGPVEENKRRRHEKRRRRPEAPSSSRGSPLPAAPSTSAMYSTALGISTRILRSRVAGTSTSFSPGLVYFILVRSTTSL